jgi:hypothetical protein
VIQPSSDLMNTLVTQRIDDLRQESARHPGHPESTGQLRTAIGNALITLGEHVRGVRTPSATPAQDQASRLALP